MANNVFNSIVGTALADGYGVLGLNVFDELTLRTAVEAAESQGASLIVQTSVKTVKAIGAKRLSDQFKLATSLSLTPVALHLDHCPDRAVISECIREGWDSVLFDASSLPLHIATAQTKEVVEEAHAQGVNVEGEIEGIQGVEDGIGSDDVPLLYPIETVIDFIETTRIDCFAPAIGTPLSRLGNRVGISETGVTGMLGGAANALALFHVVKSMSPKDKVMSIAFVVCGGFLLGDHLSFTANFQPNLIGAVLLGKLSAAVLAVILARYIAVPTAERLAQNDSPFIDATPSQGLHGK